VTQEIQPQEPNPTPQALITISVAGLDYQIRRRGAFDILIGERSVNNILENCLDTGYLSQILLTAPERTKEEQALEKISTMLTGGYRLSVCREEAGAESQGDPIPSPGEQKGLEVATRVELESESPPCYLLHLHIDPAQPPQEELTFEQRVLAVRLELEEKVAALDLRGLFRGNLQAKAEDLQAADEELPPFARP
jgi:hypothetical protein